MPNTNFQTIHQMGGAINSFVKQATGRDAVQNIDMEHITVAQNHYYEDVDISGRVVSFNAGAAGIPLEKCLVHIEPVQEGTGDPSPDNVRPISGWTKAKVFVSPTTDEADGTTYIIAFPSEAGTAYGGTLDVTTGELVVDRAYQQETAAEFEAFSSSNCGYYSTVAAAGNRPAVWFRNLFSSYGAKNRVSGGIKAICNMFELRMNDTSVFASQNRTIFVVDGTAINSVESFISAVRTEENNGSGLYIAYELENPLTYQLTPQEVRTLLGQNNIWADTGDIEVKFTDIRGLY